MIFCPGDRLVFVLWLSACQSMTFPWVSIRYQKKITHIFHMGRRHKCTKLSVLLVRTLASTCVTDSTPRRCDRVSTRYSVDFVEKNGISICLPTHHLYISIISLSQRLSLVGLSLLLLSSRPGFVWPNIFYHPFSFNLIYAETCPKISSCYVDWISCHFLILFWQSDPIKLPDIWAFWQNIYVLFYWKKHNKIVSK